MCFMNEIIRKQVQLCLILQPYSLYRVSFRPPLSGSHCEISVSKTTAWKMTPTSEETATFLGFDLSTQRLKAVQLSAHLDIIATAEVLFDTDLPEFRTSGGVNQGKENNEYFAHPVMWIKAVDIVMERLVMNGADFNTIAAICGTAQQHGSVYWSQGGIQTLKNLDANKFLHEQLQESAFTLKRSPVWMDGSTEKQCMEMEAAIGGRENMVAISGSKCYPRFTGPQIRKVYQQRSQVYETTERISLVSSFLASIFLGDVAAIDFSDGSGMNLLDINTKTWSKACLNACAPDLEQRLGTPKPTNTILGEISEYFVGRFGFSAECKILAFTGDNPSALSAMVTDKNSVVISLGTSDTILMNLEKHPKLTEGHVLCHPIHQEQFMGLLCFKNGSMLRENIKAIEAEDSWEKFNELLDSTPRGNYGNMAVHFPIKEVIPKAKGILRWSKSHGLNSKDADKGVLKFNSPQTEIRALIEGQMLHHRAVAEDLGYNSTADTRIIATGGASVNSDLLQVISDVFNAPVYVQTFSEAAMLGAAYRAAYSHYSSIHLKQNKAALEYQEFLAEFLPHNVKLICEPNKDSNEIYTPMMERYRQMAKYLELKK